MLSSSSYHLLQTCEFITEITDNFLINMCFSSEDIRFITPFNYMKRRLEKRIIKLAYDLEKAINTYPCQFEFGSSKGPLLFEQTFWIGEKVIFTTNVDTNIGIVNGSLGVIVEFKAYSIVVKCEKSNKIVQVTYTDFEGKYYHKKVRLKGRLCQLPLQQAYFCTVHKCQGLTLKRVVIDIRNTHFCHGMLYVALSRVKRLNCIIFYGKLSHLSYSIDKDNKDFSNK